MINPDLPISRASEDKLNRSSFAKSLAKVLLDYTAPYSFSIGLYGEWGSGKTSLLNMVLETVEEIDKDAVILRFNPWLCSDPNQLITQFFKQMASAIKLKKPAGDRMWELVDQYGDVFDATSLIPVAGPAIAAAGKVASINAKRRVGQRANDLQGSKDRIAKKLSTDNTKIIVAIDDIDRLSEEEIIAVFQLVKALADFPNTVYILAFDYDIVINALTKVQHGDGKEYLEKVIQVPFEIPAPNMRSIQETLFSKLNEIVGDIPDYAWDKYTWSEMYLHGVNEYVRSIRDVIRYANVFYLKYELLKEETNPVDLLGLTCLQVFEPLIYSKLPNYKELFCGGVSYSFRTQKEEKEELANAVNTLFADKSTISNENAAKHLLCTLFPKVSDAIGQHPFSGRQYVHKTFLLSNNIAEAACFDRYFSLMLEDDAISTNTIKQIVFIASSNEFKEHVEKLYQQGKIVRFLEELEAYAGISGENELSSDRAKLVLKCLAQLWHTFKVNDVGFFTIPFQWRLLFCADRLLNRITAGERGSCLKELFEDPSVQPSTLSLLLEDFETSHGRFTEKAANEGQQALLLEDVIELEGIFKKRAVAVLDSREVLDEYQGLNILWMLGNIDPSLVAEKKRTFVTDTKSLIKVLDYCFSRGVASTARASHNTWNLNKSSLEEFINLQEALDQMNAFAGTDEFMALCKEDQMNIVAFLLIMQDKDSALRENITSEEAIKRKLQELEEINIAKKN